MRTLLFALLSACLIATAFVAGPVAAQEQDIVFDGIYPQNHSRRGFGIAVHFVSQIPPPDDASVVSPVALELCALVAADLSEQIRAAHFEPTPNYLAITIKTGGMIGFMWTTFFEYDDGRCGDPMD